MNEQTTAENTEPTNEGQGEMGEAKRKKESGGLAVVGELNTKPQVMDPATGKHVAVVGLGPSCGTFLDIAKRIGGVHELCDEVWAINALGDCLTHHRVFHMDDVRVQEARAARHPESNIAAMLKWMRRHPGPIYTSQKHPDYPGLVEFPLEAVINDVGHDYLNNTAAYAVAYAIYIGVRELSVYGCDYTYPNSHDAERGRGCLEFLLGIATQRGIKITLPKNTSLMDAISPREQRIYGYDCVDMDFSVTSAGRLKIDMRPKPQDQWPTAEDIERRYDHSAHPNPLVSGKAA